MLRKSKVLRYLSLLLLVLFTTADYGRAAGYSTHKQDSVTSLTVALYPYVPRLDQFKKVIAAEWKKVQPNVTLVWVDENAWDGGYSDDPDASYDVFVFDAVYYDYFVKNKNLYALIDDKIENIDDFIPYAIDGVMKRGDMLYGIPQLGCGDFLFYRKTDTDVANASSISQLLSVLKPCTYFDVTPSGNVGLMVDFSGSTSSALNYVISLHETTKQFPVPLPLGPNQIDAVTARNIQTIVAMSSFQDALFKSDNSYQRAVWFNQGKGRAYIGFMESLTQLDPAKRNTIAFKPMLWSNDTTGAQYPLFYADIIGINATTVARGTTDLAVQLANLMASSDVIVKCFKADGSSGPQYLLPLRKSAYTTLGKDYPLYNDMLTMMQSVTPTLFNLGENARAWLAGIKSAMQSMTLANPICYCDYQAGPIFNTSDAQQKCPPVCQSHGGWNGQWTTVAPGTSVCGCNCGVH